MFSAHQLELLKKTAEELKARSSGNSSSTPAISASQTATSLVPYGEEEVGTSKLAFYTVFVKKGTQRVNKV